MTTVPRAGAALLVLLAAAAGARADEETEPRPVPVAEAVALARGAPQPLRKDGASEVDARATFRVVAAVPLADARLVLYDAQEALVPSSEVAEVGSAATRLEVRPTARLRPGGRYALRLEGAAGRELHDVAGRAYRPATFTLVAVGAPASRGGARRTRPRRGPRQAPSVSMAGSTARSASRKS